MNKLLAALALAVAFSVAQADDSRTEFARAVGRNQVPVDHVAQIAKFTYEVFIDRSVSPPLVAVRFSPETWRYLDTLGEVQIPKAHEGQPEAVRAYVETITGVPSQASPRQPKKEDRQAGPFGCPEFFAKDLRDTWYAIDDNSFLIDTQGRPGQSFVEMLGQPIEQPRDRSCQQKVGYQGILGDEGGHLVARSLGGWGGRANLTPQNSALNKLQAQAERKVLNCAQIVDVFTQWWVLPFYNDALEVKSRPIGYVGMWFISQPQCPPKYYDHQQWCGGSFGCPNAQPGAQQITENGWFMDGVRAKCVSFPGQGPADCP